MGGCHCGIILRSLGGFGGGLGGKYLENRFEGVACMLLVWGWNT